MLVRFMKLFLEVVLVAKGSISPFLNTLLESKNPAAPLSTVTVSLLFDQSASLSSDNPTKIVPETEQGHVVAKMCHRNHTEGLFPPTETQVTRLKRAT